MQFYSDVSAVRGAREMLLLLQEMGKTFRMATSRPTKLRDETRHCFERDLSGVEYGEIVFIGDLGYGGTKDGAMIELGAKSLVDDTVHNVESALRIGRRSMLFGSAPDIAGICADEARGLYRAFSWDRGDGVSTLLRMVDVP